jgi:hypothetical protein
MKLPIRSVVAGVALGMTLACLPVAAATITSHEQTISYESNGSGATKVMTERGEIGVPSSQALALMALAMIGLIAIGRRV